MQRLLNALKAPFSRPKPKAERTLERRKKVRDRKMPGVGGYIVYHQLKMKVTATKSDELWKWLYTHGWRAASYQNDRRQYQLLPDDTYGKLDFASTSERPMMIRSFSRRK